MKGHSTAAAGRASEVIERCIWLGCIDAELKVGKGSEVASAWNGRRIAVCVVNLFVSVQVLQRGLGRLLPSVCM